MGGDECTYVEKEPGHYKLVGRKKILAALKKKIKSPTPNGSRTAQGLNPLLENFGGTSAERKKKNRPNATLISSSRGLTIKRLGAAFKGTPREKQRQNSKS